ncbi:hypothetical protein WMY93_011117 [Mugilogobius chulae]|uniref:PKD domain-containing protein n=1 Tax=Mugilogobius chulae TaxID=88201 RepID=A0AAW0PMQ5_9GOBI
MARHVLALLTVLLLLGVADAVDPLTELENIAGKLVFYQMDGNATYVRNTGELASYIPTETMFELFDPQKNFSNAKFSYTWDLGNGEVIEGTEPVVRYHYAASGNYTLRLKVGVTENQTATQMTGVYSMDVTVLDAIKHIELKGPSDYEVSQNSSLAVMWTEVLPCGIRNDISKLQTSFSLFVKRNSNAHLVFILTCAAVLVATFSFIAVIACRPRRLRRTALAASSNAIFLKSLDSETNSQILFNFFQHKQRGKTATAFPVWIHVLFSIRYTVKTH